MVDWYVIKFFTKQFLIGFGVGVFLRYTLALILREKDVTPQGFINTGIVMGILYTGSVYYIIQTM